MPVGYLLASPGRSPFRIGRDVFRQTAEDGIDVGTAQFFDLAAQAPLPETCKILLSATWIVFSVLFCLDTLFRADAAGCADVATDRSAAAAGAP